MDIKRKIHNTDDLKKAMDDLQQRVKVQELELKENYTEVKENLKPTRVAKNTFSYLAETPEIQKTFINTVIGFILGYASKKAVELLREDVLDDTVQNMVNHHVSRLENKQPDSMVGKAITLFRQNTPPNSPIYPFVRYK